MELIFKKRWGVPEGLLYDSGISVWDVGGYHGQLWGSKRYICDGGRWRECELERVYAQDGHRELCRRHVPDETRPAFEAYAEQAEANFREAARRVCAASGHVDAGREDFPQERGACYCVGFFAVGDASAEWRLTDA